jgi:4-carboxymuconolactone decarboxylase
MTDKNDYDAGIALRRKMWGEAGVERIGQATALNRPFEDFVTENLFGSLWQRPGLDLRMRSIITLTALTALSKPNQLKLHVQGALANGVTVDEIREIIMHTALYSGIPTGVEAMNAAKEMLGKLGLDQA